MAEWRKANVGLVRRVQQESSDYKTYPEIEIKFWINEIEKTNYNQEGRKFARYLIGVSKGNSGFPSEDESGDIFQIFIQYKHESDLREFQVGKEITMELRKEEFGKGLSSTSLKRLNKFWMENDYGGRWTGEGDINDQAGGMGPAYGSQFYELVIMNKRVDGENSWEIILNEEKEGKVAKTQSNSSRKKEKSIEPYQENQQINL